LGLSVSMPLEMVFWLMSGASEVALFVIFERFR